jgi:predicted PurR-regulated permease PerM
MHSDQGPAASGSFPGAFVLLERRPQAITAVCLVALSIIATGVVLYVARAYLLPVGVGFVFSVILAPLCGRLEWLKIPRPIAAFAALLLAGGIAYAGFSFIAEPAARWIDQAPQTLQKAERQLRNLQAPLKTVTDLSHEMEGLSITPTAPRQRTVVVQGPELTQSLLASAQVIAVQAAFVLVLIYFFLISREDIRLKMIAFHPKLRDRVRMARIFRDVQRRVAGYIVTFSLINLAVGIAVGLACWQLGLPEPAMWGGIAAVLNFVPFVGPVITICLLALAGLSTFDTLLQASFPVLAYWLINFIESNLVTPTVMSRRMTLNPLAIILAVSFWTWIWGPVGGLISLPLLIMFKVVCDHTPALRFAGALFGAPLTRGFRTSLFGKRKPAEPPTEAEVIEEGPAAAAG